MWGPQRVSLQRSVLSKYHGPAQWQQLTSHPRGLTNWSFVQQVFVTTAMCWAQEPGQGDFWCPPFPTVQG